MRSGNRLLASFFFSVTFFFIVSTPSPCPGIEDDLGRKVILKARPARIVSLAPSLTEILFSLGAGDRIVGVTDYCDYPTEALRREKVGGLINPSIEKIVSLSPDLVLLSSEGNLPSTLKKLKSLGIPAFGVVQGRSGIGDVFKSIQTVGRAIGAEAEAENLVKESRRRIRRIRRRVEPFRRVKTLFPIWTEPFISIGGDTFMGEALVEAGGENVTSRLSGYPEIGLEEIIICGPEIIIVAEGGGHQTAGTTLQRLRKAPFVSSKRIVLIDADIVTRPTPRLIEGMEKIADLLHPGVFRADE